MGYKPKKLNTVSTRQFTAYDSRNTAAGTSQNKFNISTKWLSFSDEYEPIHSYRAKKRKIFPDPMHDLVPLWILLDNKVPTSVNITLTGLGQYGKDERPITIEISKEARTTLDR